MERCCEAVAGLDSAADSAQYIHWRHENVQLCSFGCNSTGGQHEYVTHDLDTAASFTV